MADYNVTVSLGGVPNTLGARNVKAYGAVGDGVTDDTTFIENAIAAGGWVVFPYGTYLVSEIDIATANVTLDLRSGATITTAGTANPCLDIRGVDGVKVLGGKLVGPGKGTAASGSYGIALTDASNCRVIGTEISGFYHGIRPDDSNTSVDNDYVECYIHDCAHTGIFPKDGDLVAKCRFVDLGTTSLHHGLYINTAVARGIRLMGNHYEGITGAGIHAHVSSAAAVRGIAAQGENISGCGWGVVLSTADAGATITDCHLTGLVIDGSVVTDGDTGHGVHFVTSAGSISNVRIQAVISDCAAHGFNCDASAVSDCDFDLVVGGSVDYNVVMTSDNTTGRIVAHDGTSIGVYINGGIDNHLDITATANGNTGIYLTGASEDNFLKVYSSDNTGNGLYLGASAARNRAVGVCQGNSSAQVSDGGTGNNLFGLTGSAVAHFVNAGTPEAAVTAGVGSTCSDVTNGVLYVKASGTGNTGWVVAGSQS